MPQELLLDPSILQRFADFKKRGQVAHAYLFVGPSDIGKGETALAIAKTMNCEASGEAMFCDACPSCVKISSGNHPDVLVISNGNESIKIEEIREILSRNKLRAFMGGKKVFIIRNAENLTLDAANAFLKTLEEPSADSLLLLTTAVPEKILDTVKSRCHMVHFPLMSRDRLGRRIREDGSMNEVDSHFLAYFAQGCWGTAKKLKENGFLEKKNGWIDGFILNRPDDDAVKKMLADKDETKQLLDIFLSWVRDAMLIKAGIEDGRLVHLDRKADLKQFVKRYTFEELNNINGSIIHMGRLLADNLNIKLPMLLIGEQLWER